MIYTQSIRAHLKTLQNEETNEFSTFHFIMKTLTELFGASITYFPEDIQVLLSNLDQKAADCISPLLFNESSSLYQHLENLYKEAKSQIQEAQALDYDFVKEFIEEENLISEVTKENEKEDMKI